MFGRDWHRSYYVSRFKYYGCHDIHEMFIIITVYLCIYLLRHHQNKWTSKDEPGSKKLKPNKTCCPCDGRFDNIYVAFNVKRKFW